MLSTPTLPEAKHEIVESLARYSDRELISLHQRHPQEGKFFTALFCRYAPIVYSLVQQAAESPIQADYLLALVWKQIFQELQRVQINPEAASTIWQNWFVDLTGKALAQIDIPAPAQIRYSITDAPPPLWCYLQQGLDRLPPLLRSIVVMSHSLKLSEQRISAYLKGEGQDVSATDIPAYLAEGEGQLEAALPQDIRDIYLVDSE